MLYANVSRELFFDNSRKDYPAGFLNRIWMIFALSGQMTSDSDCNVYFTDRKQKLQHNFVIHLLGRGLRNDLVVAFYFMDLQHSSRYRVFLASFSFDSS